MPDIDLEQLEAGGRSVYNADLQVYVQITAQAAQAEGRVVLLNKIGHPPQFLRAATSPCTLGLIKLSKFNIKSKLELRGAV